MSSSADSDASKDRFEMTSTDPDAPDPALATREPSPVATVRQPPRHARSRRAERPDEWHGRSSPALSGPAPVRTVGLLGRRPPMSMVATLLMSAWYAFYTGRLMVRHHNGFGTFGFDFALYDQGIWLLSRFKAPFVTIMGRNLFGDHTSFILLPLVPVYWVWPNPNLLMIAQSVGLAAGAIPIYLIARDKLGRPWLGTAFAFAYLAHPALAWTNVEQFHPDAFEAPLIGFAVWFMLRERWAPYFACVAAFLLVKEDTVLVVFVLGIYVFFKHDRKKGVITSLMGVGYAFVALYGIMRTLNGVGTLNAWRIPFGGPRGFVETGFREPGKVWDYLRGGNQIVLDGYKRPWYIWQLLAPFAGVPLLGGAVLALSFGPFASNYVSTFSYQFQIQYHYSGILVPLLAIAAVFGVGRLRHARHRTIATAAVALMALWCGYLWGPLPVSRRPTVYANPDNPVLVEIKRAIASIPGDANVAAFYGYIPHMAQRKYIYQFPTPFKAAYWRTFREEGCRLNAEAEGVRYVIVPRDIGPEGEAVLQKLIGTGEFGAELGYGNARVFIRLRPGTPEACAGRR